LFIALYTKNAVSFIVVYFRSIWYKAPALRKA